MVYKLLLFAHISFMATWIGGSFMFALLGARMTKVGPPQPEAVVRNLEFAEWLGSHFYGPLIGLTLATGIGLVVKAGIGFGHFFVLFGLGMVLFSGGLGGGFFGRKAKALIAHINANGMDAQAQSDLAQIAMVSKILIGLLFLTVFVMTYKPFS